MSVVRNFLWAFFIMTLFSGCVAVEVEYSGDDSVVVKKNGFRVKNPILNPNELRNDAPIPGSLGAFVGSCPNQGRVLEAIKQETAYWCWATSAESVMKFHGENIHQCKIVTDVKRGGLQAPTGNPICCDSPIHIDCLKNGWPENALEQYDFDFQTWSYSRLGPPTAKQISGQLCDHGPFIYIITYPGGGGHSFTVRGIREVGNQIMVEVFDHIFDNFKEIPYQKFIDGYWGPAQYTHDSDIFKITPPNRQ